MRILLRTLFAFVLLIGGRGWSWEPGPTQAAAPHACCCDRVPGPHPDCPCPKPEGPSQNGCGSRTQGPVAPLAWLQRATAGEARRREPHAWPAPVGRAVAQARTDAPVGADLGGRDPDLGRHLAGLRLLRI